MSPLPLRRGLEQRAKRGVAESERLGDRTVGDLAVDDVDALGERVVRDDRFAPPLIEPVRTRRAASRSRAPAWTWRAPHRACWPRSRRSSRSLRTSDSSASSDASPRSSHPGRPRCRPAPSPSRMRATSSLLTSFGAFAPTTRTAPITMSASEARLFDGERGGRDGLHSTVEVNVDLAQALQVAVQDLHVGVQSRGHRRGGEPGRRRRR